MKLSEKEFASLAHGMSGASDDEIIEAARRAERVPQEERKKGWLQKGWEWLNAPTIDIPEFEVRDDEHPHMKFGKRAGNLVGGVVEAMSSPMGLATAAMGGGAAVAGAKGLLGISRGARVAEAALQAPYAAEGAKNLVQGAIEQDPAKAVAGAVEGGLSAVGMRGAMKHSFPPRKVQEAYLKSQGRPVVHPELPTEFDEDLASRTALAYEQLKHAPDDPAVQASYRALVDEVEKQYDFVTKQAGVKVEPFVGEADNYPDAAAMRQDIQQNNRLTYYPSDEGFGVDASSTPNHPMMGVGKNGMRVNDMFRAIHDYFGHAVDPEGSFKRLGERRAYLEHGSMMPESALPALTTETHGQNSWVHAGPHVTRRPDGSLPQPGDVAYAPRYADQKAGLLPEEFVSGPSSRATNPPGDASVGGSAEGLSPQPIIPPSRWESLEDLLSPERSPLLTEQYGILTAANPEGQVLDEAMNAARQQQLLSELEEAGFKPIPQYGVYGGNREPSFLVPGMSGAQAKDFGRRFNQQAVISSEGWHRLGDDATFPRTSAELNQDADDFYSELGLPTGERVKYQLQFPDEAFEPASVGSATSNPGASGQLSTAMSIAGPGAAMAIPDDPDSEMDDMARVGLLGGGAAGMAARWFPKGLKNELDAIGQAVKREQFALGAKPGSFDSKIRTAIRHRIRSEFPPGEAAKLEHGYSTIELPVHNGIDFDKKRSIGKVLRKDKGGVALSGWSKQRMDAAYQMGQDNAMWGDPRWLYHATNGDPEAAVQFTRLLGAFSPQQATAENTLNAVEAFVRSAQGESPDDILSSMMHGHPLPNTVRDNFARAVQGGRIFMDKTEALGSAELGVHDKIPIDQWLLRALGVQSDKTPPKGSYRLLSEAVSKAAAEAGESPFSYMAKVWAGMQRIAGTPTRSFSEAFADIKIPGPITDPKVQRSVIDKFDDHAATLFDQEKAGSISPIATSPQLSYEQWLERAQSMLRAGYEGGDVIGKKVFPKTERPTTLDKLRVNEQRRFAQ